MKLDKIFELKMRKQGILPKKEKYKRKTVEESGRRFDSKGERDLFKHIQMLEAAKEVELISCQVQVYLTKANIQMIPDFHVRDLGSGENEYWEFKGFETPVWRLKRRLWPYYGPGRLRVFKQRRSGEIFETESLEVIER